MSPRWPQGQGFIAATSWKRAGSRSALRTRAIVTDALFERLPQRLERAAPELGQLVEEQDAVVRERDLARGAGSSRRPRARRR